MLGQRGGQAQRSPRAVRWTIIIALSDQTQPKMHILLVEDDPTIADSVTRALKSQGHAVDWTNKGEPVAKTLERDPYDVLILDVGLPGIDGFEVLRRVRSRRNTIPVLILTATTRLTIASMALSSAQTTIWSSLSRWPSFWPESKPWHDANRPKST